tara:strand:- start:466 stop:684 length:219 start_codon:yes stop_codon:yes gene_type:complete
MTKDLNQYDNKQLYALLKLMYLKEHKDGVTHLMFDDWIAEIDANIKRKDEIDSLIKRMPNFNAKEYDYERSR